MKVVVVVGLLQSGKTCEAAVGMMKGAIIGFYCEIHALQLQGMLKQLGSSFTIVTACCELFVVLVIIIIFISSRSSSVSHHKNIIRLPISHPF